MGPVIHYLRETARSFYFITVKSPEPSTMVSVKSLLNLAVRGSEIAKSSLSRDF